MCRAREDVPTRRESSLLRARSVRAGIAAAAFAIVMIPLRAGAAERVDAAVVAAIIAESQQNSEAPKIFYELTDRLGPRLSGSPAYDRAARWAVERFQTWGLASARLEPFAFGRGWTLRALTVEMVAPRYMPLTGYAEAWSPPTGGVLSGTPVYVGDSSAEEIDSLADRLRSAIVLAARRRSSPARGRSELGSNRQSAFPVACERDTSTGALRAPSCSRCRRRASSELDRARNRAGAGRSEYAA
jgi:hypothetical protein